MERINALSTGTKLVLVAGPLLFVSLFFTWQKLEIDYGRAGRGEMLLDGWDRWGLLIGLLILALVTLVVIVQLTDVEMSPDVPWDRLILALGATILVLTLVKNLGDADSTWTSYVFVLMAALVAVGAYLGWAEARPDRPSVLGRSRRGFSRAA